MIGPLFFSAPCSECCFPHDMFVQSVVLTIGDGDGDGDGGGVDAARLIASVVGHVMLLNNGIEKEKCASE